MIRIFKTNSPLNYAIMFALMIVFWAFKFIFMPTGIENYETTGLFSINLGQTLSLKYLSAFLSFTAYYLFALLIIKINSDLLIVENAYQSPGILYVIMSGFYINSQQISPLLFSGMLVFVSISILMYAHTKHIALSNAFNAGFVFAVAILIYPKFVLFLPLVIIVLYIVKRAVWREIVVLFLGIIAPLILYYSLSWLYGDISSVLEKTRINLLQTFHVVRYTKYNIIIFAPLTFWAITAIISKFNFNALKKVSTRKFQTATSVTVLFFLVFFLCPMSPDESISAIYAPASLMLSSVIINSKKKIRLLVFWGIVVSVIFTQIYQISFYLSVF